MITTTFPLRRWIKRATELQGSNHGHPITQAYLATSLRIAISLADQISDAEELLSAVGLSSGLESLPPPFPVACVDWADCVTVGLKLSSDDSELLRSLPVDGDLFRTSCSEEEVQPEDFEKLLKLIVEDATEGERERDREDEKISRANADDTSGSFFSVDWAQLSSDSSNNISNNANDHAGTINERLQRIYSLGLVLYELFSGGDLPPPDLLVVHNASEGSLSAMRSFSLSLNVSDEINIWGSSNNDNFSCDGLDNEFDMDYVSRSKRQYFPPGQSISSSSQSICNVSVDHLRVKGVPTPLCDLIHNMIDCINGDFMGNDSYCQMSEVTSDLQLMLSKPSVYLHDLDVNRISVTGLELDEATFVRDEELASLQSAYQRSVMGSSELAIVTGVSGTGKSTLATKFGDFVMENGGLFLSGKFDQIKYVKPYSAVASAFNTYCEVLARETASEGAVLVASNLKTALGSDLYYLIQMIPSLGRILQEHSNDYIPPGHDCVNAQERLHYLFCQFVEVISRCSGAPMTLFMDDVQWADSASISIISQLLKTSRSMKDSEGFFFLGCCRDDEMSSHHLFWKMIDNVRSFGFKTTLVKLECMDIRTVNTFLSTLLHLPPRLVRSLSNIVHHKTKGNPLFVSRLLISLNREGLLRLSLTRHRWEWDEEKIQSRKLSDDVATFFVDSINKLPADVKTALSALSCFGASTDSEVIRALETNPELTLIEPLNVAVSEGLVYKLDGIYHFCHDKIQQAAYSMIEHVRCFHHMMYGLSLMHLSLENADAGLLFTAVTQMNLGGPSAVQEKQQYSAIANYNLIAGKKAMEMSDFSLAFAFFDHGISFLRKHHWQYEYDLSLDLFNLAAKCALTIKNLTSLTMICYQILRNARNPDDMLNASFISMSALTYSKVSEAVHYGFTVLRQLNIDIPGCISQENTTRLIFQTKSQLDDISDETILNYQTMSDFKKVMAMKFLAELGSPLQQVNPDLQPYVTITMVRLTIEHGLSPTSSVGFAYFGEMVGVFGDFRAAYRFTKLAKSLLDKTQSNEVAGRVICITTEVLSYVQPQQTAIEYRLQGERIALAAGDVHWACLNKLLYTCSLPWSGAKLSVAKKAFIDAGRVSNFSRYS
eukprot:CCRYP_001485-RA/>CCRYP_001485-RA protein AED:0.02 eAED:0.02 QI:1/1/1/1/1/1/2/1352/1114